MRSPPSARAAGNDHDPNLDAATAAAAGPADNLDAGLEQSLAARRSICTAVKATGRLEALRSLNARHGTIVHKGGGATGPATTPTTAQLEAYHDWAVAQPGGWDHS